MNSPRAPRPPRYPARNFFLGNLQDRSDDSLGFFERIRDFAPVASFRLLFLEMICLSHPDAVKHVLLDSAAKYSKGRGFKQIAGVLGQGLITAEGELWRKHRRLTQPSFHRERIEKLCDQMTQSTEQHLLAWEANVRDGSPLDVHREMMALTLSIVGSTLFGSDLSGSTHQVGEAVHVLLDELTKRAQSLNPFYAQMPTEANRRFNRVMKTLDDVVLGIIDGRRKAGGEEKSDLLGMWMAARDADTNETLSNVELRDEVMSLMLAGHETTANALSWAFYLLSQHPEALRKVHAELHAVLGGRTPRVQDLPKLTYLTQVFEETLRLYPPAWMQVREPLEDDVIMGQHIPKGRFVLMCNWSIQRDPKFWPRPNAFEPERFSREQPERPRGAYFPFGMGQRMCIGISFAQMEAQLILATVLQRFDMKCLATAPIEPEPLLTLRPKGGLPMQLQRRASSAEAA